MINNQPTPQSDEALFMAAERLRAQEIIDTGMPIPERQDVKWVWENSHQMLEVEASFRGGFLRRNMKTETWEIVIPKNATPIMNDLGVNTVMAFYRANINPGMGTSVMPEDRVFAICLETNLDLNDMLYVNQKKFGLHSSQFLFVARTFMNNFETNLRKSIGGKALMAAIQGERVLETRQTIQQPQSGGLLGKVFGRR